MFWFLPRARKYRAARILSRVHPRVDPSGFGHDPVASHVRIAASTCAEDSASLARSVSRDSGSGGIGLSGASEAVPEMESNISVRRFSRKLHDVGK